MEKKRKMDTYIFKCVTWLMCHITHFICKLSPVTRTLFPEVKTLQGVRTLIQK